MSLYQEACKYIPGGVNSPVRAFRGVGGEPIFFRKAAGAYLTAADGRRYLDYVGSWGPMILGHAHPQVIEAVQAVAADRNRDRAGAPRDRTHALPGSGALREFGHGGDHERDPPGARLYRTRHHRE